MLVIKKIIQGGVSASTHLTSLAESAAASLNFCSLQLVWTLLIVQVSIKTLAFAIWKLPTINYTFALIELCLMRQVQSTHQHSEWWPQKKGICSQSFSGAQSDPPDETHSSKVWKTTQTLVSVYLCAERKTISLETHSFESDWWAPIKDLFVALFPSSKTRSVVVSEAQEVVVGHQALYGVPHNIYVHRLALHPVSKNKQKQNKKNRQELTYL